MLKHILMACLGIFSLLYLLNIGAGIFEMIPDNLPVVGNLDEGGAVALLLMCLRHFGFDPTNFFNKKGKKKHVVG